MATTLSRCLGAAQRCFSVAAPAAAVAHAAPLVAPAPPSPSATGYRFPVGPSTTPTGQLKFKNSFKRASEVMTSVKRGAEECMAIKLAHIREPIPKFEVGDAIEITYAQELTEASPIPVRGTVISKTNRGVDSKFTILNAWDGEYYTASYVYSTPLLRGIKVLMRNRLKLAGLRVRRAKLTYLLGADPNVYYVDANTKEPEVAQAEKEERRRLARLGKLGGKNKREGSERAGAAAEKKVGAPAAGAGGAKAAAAPAKGAAPAKAKK